MRTMTSAQFDFLHEAFRLSSIADSCVNLEKQSYWSGQYHQHQETWVSCFPSWQCYYDSYLAFGDNHRWFRGEVVPLGEMPEEARSPQTDNTQPRQKPKMNYHYIQTCADESIETISVVFAEDAVPTDQFEGAPKRVKTYTFKTRLIDLAPGDFVLVDTAKGVRLAQVTELHDFPQIDEQDTMDYRWAFSKVDLSKAALLREEDLKFQQTIRDHKRKAHRKQIAEKFKSGQFLEVGIDDE